MSRYDETEFEDGFVYLVTDDEIELFHELSKTTLTDKDLKFAEIYRRKIYNINLKVYNLRKKSDLSLEDKMLLSKLESILKKEVELTYREWPTDSLERMAESYSRGSDVPETQFALEYISTELDKRREKLGNQR